MALTRVILSVLSGLCILALCRTARALENPFRRDEGPVRSLVRRVGQSTKPRLAALLSGGVRRTRDLPYAIETLNLCCMSGMSLLQAIDLVGRSGKGRVFEAFALSARDFTAGLSRREVLDRLHERIGGQGAYALVSALRRADQSGTPLASILHAQAENARRLDLNERMKAIEMAPLWVVIVTVVFLLPTIICVAMVPHLLAFLSTGW